MLAAQILPGSESFSEASGGIAVGGSGDSSFVPYGRYPFSEKVRVVSLVEQQDFFENNVTVQEHLMFHARLRLWNHMRSSNEPETTVPLAALQSQRVKEVLERLRLEHCAERRVGYLSGGERKRLSIAEELLNESVKILLVDEPCTGLDSTVAREVVEILFGMQEKDSSENQSKNNSTNKTQRSTTILFTIHQPSSLIYRRFRNVYFMGKGDCCYFGAADAMAGCLSAKGFSFPDGYNAAEFALELIQDDEKRERLLKGCVSSHERISEEKLGTDNMSADGTKTTGTGTRSPPWFVQVREIHWRTHRARLRRRFETWLTLYCNSALLLLTGWIFFRVPAHPRLKNTRNGAAFFFFVHPQFSAAFEAMINLVHGSRLLRRELLTKRLYSLSAYMVGRATGELPISSLFPLLFTTAACFLVQFHGIPLIDDEVTAAFFFEKFFTLLIVSWSVMLAANGMGALVAAISEDHDVAVSLLIMILVPMLLLNGYMLDLALLPVWLRPVRLVSLAYWGFNGIAVWAWQDVRLESCSAADALEFPADCSFRTGEEILRQNFGIDLAEDELGPDYVWTCVFALLLFAAITRSCAFCRAYLRYMCNDSLPVFAEKVGLECHDMCRCWNWNKTDCMTQQVLRYSRRKTINE
ncbi:unnamed protein product [Amoebophrya sp. A25]|nr:unnamed protein product [Amoebophrya sp. A25]|eukprot:GSA25T00002205001.1